ncbi:hypothetical protein COE53_08835 [Bacillus sp. AFS029533]|nr:hypothetical protein COE53_08835 [Bacillus sp. AFS029533]
MELDENKEKAQTLIYLGLSLLIFMIPTGLEPATPTLSITGCADYSVLLNILGQLSPLNQGTNVILCNYCLLITLILVSLCNFCAMN